MTTFATLAILLTLSALTLPWSPMYVAAGNPMVGTKPRTNRDLYPNIIPRPSYYIWQRRATTRRWYSGIISLPIRKRPHP
uniref:Uncharacterized protein n=1 Tax=Rhipicephalus appendiculatus TaxID=34631 RepID=A0A131YEG6_RHIAP